MRLPQVISCQEEILKMTRHDEEIRAVHAPIFPSVTNPPKVADIPTTNCDFR